MPGFTPVEQVFTVNAAEYLAGVQEMIESTDALAASIDAAAEAAGRMDVAGVGGAGAAGADAAATDADKSLADAQTAVADTGAEASAAMERLITFTDESAAASAKAATAFGEFDVSVDEMVTACDEAAVAIDRQTVALKEAGDTAETSTGKTAAFGSGSKMAFLAVGAAVAYSVVKAAEFQTQVTRLQTAAGLTGANMKDVAQQILNIGTQTGYTGTEIAEAMYHPISAGLSLKTALDLVAQAADLANIHGANLEDTTYGLSSVMKAFNLPATQVTHTAALLNAVVGEGDMRFQDFNSSIQAWAPTAASMGISIRSVGAALDYLTDRGNNATSAATRMTMGLTMVTSGSIEANTFLKSLGLTTGSVTIQNKSLEQVMNHFGLTTNKIAADLKKPDGIYTALSSIKDAFRASGLSASQADAVMAKIFGGGRTDKAIVSLMQNLGAIKTKYDQIGKSVKDYGKSVETEQQTTEQKWKDAKAAIGNLAISFGSVLLPAVTKILGALDKFFQFIQKHPLLAKFAGGLAALAISIGLVSGAMAIFNAVMAIDPVVLIVLAVIALAVALYELYKHCKTVRDAVHDLVGFFKSAWKDAMHAAGDVIQWFVNGPLAFIKQQIKAFQAWWYANHKEIEEVTKAAWALISGVIRIYMAIITAEVKIGLTFLKSIWTTVWDLIRDVVKLVWDTIAVVIKVALNIIRDTIAIYLDIITGHWSKAWADLKRLASDALHGAIAIIKTILGGFVTIMWDLGRNLIMGFINGIKAMIGGVIGAAESIGHAAINAVKGVLSSLSPSKKAHYEGQMFGQGLIDGMDSYRGLVGASAGKLAAAMTAGAHATLSGASGGSSGPGGSGAVNINVTVNGFVGSNQQLATTLQPVIMKAVNQYQRRNSSNGLSLAGR